MDGASFIFLPRDSTAGNHTLERKSSGPAQSRTLTHFYRQPSLVELEHFTLRVCLPVSQGKVVL
jgi:hypothetical protein